MHNTQKIILTFLLIAGFGSLFFIPLFLRPVSAQIYYNTPTAFPNGNVYYTVRANETCESIAALTGVNLDTLRQINKLGLNDCNSLQIGQLLLLGTVPTPVITVGPSPTPTGNFPTPEPSKGYGTICVYLYNDVNGNAMADPAEITNTGLAGGEISITDKAGDFTKTGTTVDTGDPVCFQDAPEGEYTISIAIPDGYNPTASQNYTLDLKAGDTATVDFSAQASSTQPIAVTKTENHSSLFLAVFGGIIVLAGVVLGLYARFIRRK
jgi:hypothetical protein